MGSQHLKSKDADTGIAQNLADMMKMDNSNRKQGNFFSSVVDRGSQSSDSQEERPRRGNIATLMSKVSSDLVSSIPSGVSSRPLGIRRIDTINSNFNTNVLDQIYDDDES